MKPRVVNVKFDSYDVYIGRSPEFGDTRWGNPYRVPNNGTREDVVAKYDAWVRARLCTDPRDKALLAKLLLVIGAMGAPASISRAARGRFRVPDGDELREELRSLAGKTLGCHCKAKGGLGAVACHGDPLAQIVLEVVEGKL